MRKRKTPYFAILALLVIAWLVAPDLLDPERQTNDSPAAPVMAEQGTLFEVIRVVDGDTIVIDYHDSEEKVRLIGVDTPESVHPDKARNTEYGKLASAFAKEKLEGQWVTLEFDAEERDRYGRLLAYVYLDGVMFNKTLLSSGYAAVATFPPNVKYVEDFVALQQEAREANAGLWQGGAGEGAYVASLTGSEFHVPDCPDAAKINADDQIWFIDAAAATAAGYTACSCCLEPQ
ncbi:MAG: hypothetical protein GX572_02620 [Clostridia bacterium]|nr:hypothetical protein [Clostridia bacterium]